MTAFYLSMECRNCDEEIFEGLNVTTLEHNGYPVVPFDIASQTSFECRQCGASNHTGDFEDVLCEGGDPVLGDVMEDDEAVPA